MCICIIFQGKLEVQLGVLLWTIKDELLTISVADNHSYLGNRTQMLGIPSILVCKRTGKGTSK